MQYLGFFFNCCLPDMSCVYLQIYSLDKVTLRLLSDCCLTPTDTVPTNQLKWPQNFRSKDFNLSVIKFVR